MYETVKKIHNEIKETAKTLRKCTFKGIMTANLTAEENEAIGELRMESFYGKTLPETDRRLLAGCFLKEDGSPLVFTTDEAG